MANKKVQKKKEPDKKKPKFVDNVLAWSLIVAECIIIAVIVLIVFH